MARGQEKREVDGEEKLELEAYAPVALLSQQCFKPHLSVITSEEGGERVRGEKTQGMDVKVRKHPLEIKEQEVAEKRINGHKWRGCEKQEGQRMEENVHLFSMTSRAFMNVWLISSSDAQ